MSQKISRAQWAQIQSRAQKTGNVFDPKWKCLIDGSSWTHGNCGHTVDDQHDILAQLAARS